MLASNAKVLGIEPFLQLALTYNQPFDLDLVFSSKYVFRNALINGCLGGGSSRCNESIIIV